MATARYDGDFEKREDIESEFGDELHSSIEIIYADYSQGNYEGTAHVLYRQHGKLFTVDAYHCSCHGLDGMWEPVETTLETIRHLADNGSGNTKDYAGHDFFALGEVPETKKKFICYAEEKHEVTSEYVVFAHTEQEAQQIIHDREAEPSEQKIRKRLSCDWVEARIERDG